MQTNYLGFYYEIISIRGPQNGGAPGFSQVRTPPPLIRYWLLGAHDWNLERGPISNEEEGWKRIFWD